MRASRFHIIAALFISSLFLPGCAFFRPSAESLYHKNITGTSCYDVIIVPGAPVNSDYSRKLVQMRVAWAVHLYKQGLTKKIIMSGSAVSTPYKESVIMRLYAISMGVPPEDVYTEEKAQHTTENVWYGYHQAKELGCSKIALATDPFQTRLVYGYTKRKLPDVEFLPLLMDTLSVLPDTLPEIDMEQYRIEDFTPLCKKQNRIQMLRGTFGRYIDYKKDQSYSIK
jgi:uncharacterized SAM-binding protein YcdF (DUF218 family)